VRFFLTFIGICVLASCQQKQENVSIVEYRNGRQLLTLNNKTKNGEKLAQPSVELLAPDTIEVNEKFKAQIYLGDKNYRLIAAYFDCQLVANPTVDTVVYTANDYKRLDGCKKELFVKNDTIRIEFQPTTSGIKTFSEITILTLDKEQIFRTQNYSFRYYVAE